MPELPDLEIVRRVLAQRILGVPIASAEVLRPMVAKGRRLGTIQ